MCHPLFAGMPNVNLTDVATVRLQTLSFFLLLFLASALVVWRVWNGLRADFRRLPRLSYPKALGVVGLWGLLFLLVLTMISGARELMTPGAWKKEPDGATYALNTGTTVAERREKLFQLYEALTTFAAHHGHFPKSADEPGVPPAAWASAHSSGMRFVYVGGRTAADAGRVLACEPELFGDGRLVLFVGGAIRRATSAELAALLAAEGR